MSSRTETDEAGATFAVTASRRSEKPGTECFTFLMAGAAFLAWMREELAADAADSGIRMFSIAFTENADFFLIQSLAKRTGGEYFRALTPDDLAGVFGSVQAALVAPRLLRLRLLLEPQVRGVTRQRVTQREHDERDRREQRDRQEDPAEGERHFAILTSRKYSPPAG